MAVSSDSESAGQGFALFAATTMIAHQVAGSATRFAVAVNDLRSGEADRIRRVLNSDILDLRLTPCLIPLLVQSRPGGRCWSWCYSVTGSASGWAFSMSRCMRVASV